MRLLCRNILQPYMNLDFALLLWEQSGAEHWIPVTGTSMRPLIQPGDLVLVKHGALGIRPGDVIVYRREDRMTVHRVVGLGDNPPEMVITRGDTAGQVDPPVDAAAIVGRVVAIKRGDRLCRLDAPGRRMLNRMIGPNVGRCWRGLKRLKLIVDAAAKIKRHLHRIFRTY